MRRRMRQVAVGAVLTLFAISGTAHAQNETTDDEPEEVAVATDFRQVEQPPDVEARWRPWQQRLEYATAGALTLTAVGGALTALNKPTLLYDGRCELGNPIFGDYGCNGLNRLHGIGGATASVLYTSEQVMDMVLPGGPETSTFGAVLDGVHTGGMVLAPILGFLSAEPQTIGIPEGSRDGFSRTSRTIHASLALVTLGAYVTSMFVD